MRAHLCLTTALCLTVAAAAQTPKNSGPTTLDSSPLPAQSTASATVSVPIQDGDPATVTGNLALRTRAGKQFLVIESPTPYRLVLPPGHLGTPNPVIRDIAFTLPGQTAAITPAAGRTITATGRLRILPRGTWNGALLEATTVILPGGKQLHARH